MPAHPFTLAGKAARCAHLPAAVRAPVLSIQ